ncbi:MAG: hypothetical protein OXN89_13295 [Bryobacterales bacterium]|nr:hypothetical protein [Bryobacterales bacterium]
MPAERFSYFSEVEDRFRMARNSGMFMMSPLDWVLVESWKDAGLPLEAVLHGIDRAFAKYHARRAGRRSRVNSLAYCTQEVHAAARDIARGSPPASPTVNQGTPGVELASFFDERAEQLSQAAEAQGVGSELFLDAARTLRRFSERASAGQLENLEAVEQRLASLEDRVVAVATLSLSEDQLLAIRRELDGQLRPYRRKMSSEQLSALERGFKRRKSLEALGLSRLSLFYAV